jgi:hypothetical protein
MVNVELIIWQCSLEAVEKKNPVSEAGFFLVRRYCGGGGGGSGSAGSPVAAPLEP